MKLLLPFAAAALVAMPAHAGVISTATLLKLAPLVLKNKALLDKGQAQCGQDAALKPQESLLNLAVGAAIQKALPVKKFDALSMLANRQATSASLTPGFCTRAVAQKPGLLGTIADAAGKLGVGGDLGSMAGVLGGGGGAGGSDAVTGALGGLLGGH